MGGMGDMGDMKFAACNSALITLLLLRRHCTGHHCPEGSDITDMTACQTAVRGWKQLVRSLLLKLADVFFSCREPHKVDSEAVGWANAQKDALATL